MIGYSNSNSALQGASVSSGGIVTDYGWDQLGKWGPLRHRMEVTLAPGEFEALNEMAPLNDMGYHGAVIIALADMADMWGIEWPDLPTKGGRMKQVLASWARWLARLAMRFS